MGFIKQLVDLGLSTILAIYVCNRCPKEVHVHKFPVNMADIKRLVVVLCENSDMMTVMIHNDICLMLVREDFIRDIPKEYFAAALSHEIGHVIMGHLHRDQEHQYDEMEADRYAASIHGTDTMINTLKYVLSKARNPNIVQELISTRIAVLTE